MSIPQIDKLGFCRSAPFGAAPFYGYPSLWGPRPKSENPEVAAEMEWLVNTEWKGKTAKHPRRSTWQTLGKIAS